MTSAVIVKNVHCTCNLGLANNPHAVVPWKDALSWVTSRSELRFRHLPALCCACSLHVADDPHAVMPWKHAKAWNAQHACHQMPRA